MFELGDYIYIKKYFGDTLKADTSKMYKITMLLSREENTESLLVELDNRKSYYIEENGIIYGEKVETNYFCWFCM